MPLRASLNTSHSKPPAISRASAWRLAPSPVAYTRKPQIKNYYNIRTRGNPAATYFILGARRFTRLMILRALTSSISDNCALVRFDVRRRRWLLPPLVRTTLPDPVRRKRLDVALWVFSLVM